MLVVHARDKAQEQSFRGLFDRSDLHAELLQSVQAIRRSISKATEAELHKALRGFEQQLQAIQARIQDFQGKTWATRKRPRMDRLATAWLVRRFIDKSPRFVWLDNPKKCPKAALGYAFDGERFTQVDDKVTFEVVACTFGLVKDPGIKRLGELVHRIDVGGIAVDEAAGIETVVRGLHAQHARDDELLAAATQPFDTLYAAVKVRP